jgi:hypothetical protein
MKDHPMMAKDHPMMEKDRPKMEKERMGRQEWWGSDLLLLF